jgi:hypothetical protein
MAIDKEDVEKIARATADEVVERIKEKHDISWFARAPIDKVVSDTADEERVTRTNYELLADRIEGMSPVWPWAKSEALKIRQIADQEMAHGGYFMSLYLKLKERKEALAKTR